jgi:hypothetical protein
MAMELAAAGIVCGVLDFFGERPDESRQRLPGNATMLACYDVGSAVRHLRSLPEVNPSQIGLVGHSFGATVVMKAALRDTAIAATVMLGMSGDVGAERPANVLVIAGLYDEFYPVPALTRAVASSACGASAEPNILYGGFAAGTARQVEVVPTANHVTEPLNPAVIGEVIRWLEMAYTGRSGDRALSYTYSLFTKWGALLGCIVLLALVLDHVGARSFLSGGHSHASPPTTGGHGDTLLAARLLILLTAGSALLLSTTTIWPDLPRSGFLLCTVAVIVSGRILAWQRRGRTQPAGSGVLPPSLRWLLVNALALYTAYCATMIGGNLLNYFKVPRLAAWVPVFPFYTGYLWLIHALQKTTALAEWYLGLGTLRIVAGAICAAEVIRPGITLELPDRVAAKLAPHRARRGRKFGATVARIVLGGLVVSLAALGWRRYQEGFLTDASVRVFGSVALRVYLPVVVLFLVIRRSNLPARLLRLH